MDHGPGAFVLVRTLLALCVDAMPVPDFKHVDFLVLPPQEEDNSCLVKAFCSLFFTVLRSL